MKRSGLLKKQNDEIRFYSEMEEHLTRQLMIDTASIALNQMGWGYDRIMKFMTLWGDAYSYYYRTRNYKDPECDYFREYLDRDLKRIVKNKGPFHPFEKRYPQLKKPTY